jgi:tetratricopeptide (TPR) repeat protein
MSGPERRRELEAELKRLRLKRNQIDDADVRRALDEAIARAETDLQALPKPAPVDSPVPPPPTKSGAPPAVASPQQVARAEELLRMANVEKVKGHAQRALELREEAAEAAPGSLNVLMALADNYIERGQWVKARSALEKARELDPKNALLERRYAEAVLRASGAADFRLDDPDGLLGSLGSSPADARSAAVLGFILPGLGQLVQGKIVTGLTLLLVWGVAVFFVFLLRNDLTGLLAMAGLAPTGSAPTPNLGVLVPIGVAMVAHLISIQLGVAGMRSPRRKLEIDRPAPPVDKRFEL